MWKRACAHEEGDLSASTDPQQAARAIVAVWQDIFFIGRAGIDIARLRATAEMAADQVQC